MRHSINDADWIDPEAAEKLRKLGIKSCASLLDAGASLKGRKQLACATGLDERQILHWTNTADRLRIKGIGAPYAQLLHYAGVDTINALKIPQSRPPRAGDGRAERQAQAGAKPALGKGRQALDRCGKKAAAEGHLQVTRRRVIKRSFARPSSRSFSRSFTRPLTRSFSCLTLDLGRQRWPNSASWPRSKRP